MTVSLSEELESLLNEKLKSGMYQSANEVLLEGLQLLDDRDRLEALRSDVQEGFDAIDRGEYEEYDDESLTDLVADIKARGMATLALEKKNGMK